MKTRFDWARGCATVIGIVCAAASADAIAADGITVLHAFNYADGQYPQGPLVELSDHSLIGTTYAGGSNGLGTVFRVTASGTHSILHSFSGADGNSLNTGLIAGIDGNYYGTTPQGSTCIANSCSSFGGTAYKLDSGLALTTLHAFKKSADGWEASGIADGLDGALYGLTRQGGTYNIGTAFKISASGDYTVLHSFGENVGEGFLPVGRLVRASNGVFYGVTAAGGSANLGTVFSLTADGVLTTLHSFTGADGASPRGTLIVGTDGQLYGATNNGGPNDTGTVFRMSTSGSITTLHAFNGGDGAYPAGLVQAGDGHFYGVTSGGGTQNYGTLFEISDGTLVTLHLFTTADGTYPSSVPLIGTDGKLYGTTRQYGGASGASGSVYRFDPTAERSPVLNLSKTCYNEFNTCFKPINTKVGQSVSLSWSSANLDHCVASGAWEGDRPTGGFYRFTVPRAGVLVYRLNCTGPAGESKAVVTLTAVP